MAKPEPAEAGTRSFLSFLVGGVECALDLVDVREIVRYERATRVPRVPAAVRGVVNLRGTVLPVIDLAVGFGMPAAPVTPETCLLVVEVAFAGEHSAVGLLADAVSQVMDLHAEDVEPAPAFGTPVPAAYLLGMARSSGGFSLVLDLRRLVGEGALLDGAAPTGRAALAAPAVRGDSA